MNRSSVIRVLFVASIAVYPFIILAGLEYFPPSFFALALLVLLGFRYGVLLPEERPVLLPVLLIFVTYAVIAAATGSARMLLFYPALVNVTLCGIFLNSLRQGDPLLLRILRARNWPLSEHAPTYLYRLTAVWAGFFVFNAAISIWTTTLDLKIWTLYNGFLSYCLVALFVGVEYLYRRHYKRRMGVDNG